MIKIFTILVYFLLLTGCQESPDKKINPLNAARTVSVTTVEAKDTPVTFEYIAQTQSSRLVNIQARVSGFLEKRMYTEGEMVKEGQVLFLMDKKPFLAQVDASKAALARQQAAMETARLNLDRVKPLTEKNALSQKDLDDAIGRYQASAASVEQAKADLLLSKLNLSYCTITSPLDGISSAALQQDGSYINLQDSKLTTVAALDPIWVNFSLSENQLQTYQNQILKKLLIPPKDNEYDIEVVLIDGTIFPYRGKITFTAPYYNQQTGTFLIRASLQNPKGQLRPNQYVRVKAKGAYRPDAILVPQKAVQETAKGRIVWVVNENNEVEPRPVTVGDWQKDGWFINSGLKSGETIVLDGAVMLRPGSKVTIKN